jgi:hypothetical protein
VRFQRGRLTIIRCSSAGRRTYPSVVSVCRRRPDFRVNDAQPGLAAGAETGIAPSAPGRLRCGHRGHRGLILLPVRLRRVRHPYRLGSTAPPLRSSSSASATAIDGSGPPRSRAARRRAATKCTRSRWCRCRASAERRSPRRRWHFTHSTGYRMPSWVRIPSAPMARQINPPAW